MKKKKHRVSAILLNIRSVHNVGSMFRTADALNVDKIFLVGYTPAPVDRFGKKREDLSKVALGAEKNIPWESITDANKLIAKLKKEKISIVAVEQHKKAKDYKKFKIKKPTAFIFGNEVDGIPEKILSKSDEILSIPMRGKKESLNVSVSFGIALSRILDL